MSMKSWRFWDWTAYAALAIAAFMTAFDSALKNSAALAKLLPGLTDSTLWAITPAVLVVIASVLLILRARQQPSMKADEAKAPDEAQRRRVLPMVGPFQVSFEPPSDFRLLPLQYTVNFATTLPDVEVRLWAVNFLPRPFTLSKVALALRLFSSHILEDVTEGRSGPKKG